MDSSMFAYYFAIRALMIFGIAFALGFGSGYGCATYKLNVSAKIEQRK